MPGALDGIRVLDWTVFHNGATVGYMLADLGAEVIHIERPVTGDPYRGIETMHGSSMRVPGVHGDTVNISFETVNRNKKGIILDLSKPKGHEVLCQLVEKSDVFVTNFRKSVATRLNLDYKTLSKHNPKIIYVISSGLGSKGPESNNRCFDTVALARSGIMFQVGQRDESEPLVPVGGIADQLGGMMTAYAVLAGLVCRERQGIGQVVESSLLGSMIHLQAVSVNSNLWRGRPRARHSRKRARNPLGNIYLCADDEWLFLSEPQSDRFWSQFCQAVGIPELEKDTRFENAKKRADNREQLISILDEIFMKKNRKEWIEILRPTGMAVDSVLKIPDLTEDRQVLENRYIVEMDHTRLGPVKSLGFPIELSKTPPSITRCAPEFGEHTEEVLMEILGYKWNDIARLKEEGVI